MRKRIIVVSLILILCSISFISKDFIMKNIKKMTTDVTAPYEEVEIGTGSGRYSWKQTIRYHSNYPDGRDYVVTIVYNIRSLVSTYNYFDIKKPDDFEFEMEGYTVQSNWNTRADGRGEDYKMFCFEVASKNKITDLYAVWKMESNYSTYTVTYTDGVLGETVFPDESTEGLKVEDATPVFMGSLIRECYEFVGWILSTNESKPITVNPIVSPDDANENFEIIYVAMWKRIKKITGIEKKLVEKINDVPSNISISGISYPNADGEIIIPADDNVKLLYTITITGTPSTEYKVTDTDATYVGGDYLEGAIPESGKAIIYVMKSFTEADISDEGKIKNSATVTPGKNDEPTSSCTEITPAIVYEEDSPAIILDKLSILKRANTTVPIVGEEFKYTIKIENPTSEYISVDVSDVLPNSLTFVAATGDGIEKDGIVTWENVTIHGNNSRQLSLTVKANKATTIENTATIHLNNLTKSSNTEIVTPKKSEPTYTVIYKDNDNSFSLQVIRDLEEGRNTPKFKEELGKTEILEDGTIVPIREGYRFVGWSKKINKVVLAEDANENYEIIYVAMWQKMSETTDKEEAITPPEDNNSNEIEVPLTEDKIIKYLISGIVSTLLIIIIISKNKRTIKIN